MLPIYKKKKTASAKKKPDLIKKLDKVFALYIRLRDIMPNGYGKCISCGRIMPYAQLDCGHYHSRTHMATRFDEDNCNIECHWCNRLKSDHLIGYQENLIRKIGMGRYDRLKLLASTPKHWCDFELEEMIKHYKEEVKRLSAIKGIKV